jgi:sigma-B regulation protein RsbU (phosphoserine phosphatase)
LLAAAVQTTFAAQAPVSDDPAQAMDRVNKALLRRAIEARFATMFFGTITPAGGLRYCNAGHEPALCVSASGTKALSGGGPVLGLLPFASYDCMTVTLAPGDLIVVCSDGVTEARNRDDEEFGRDRVSALVGARHGAAPDTVLELLLRGVREFSQGAAQSDDVTALVVRYRGAS